MMITTKNTVINDFWKNIAFARIEGFTLEVDAEDRFVSSELRKRTLDHARGFDVDVACADYNYGSNVFEVVVASERLEQYADAHLD